MGGQPGLQGETLSQRKKKRKKEKEGVERKAEGDGKEGLRFRQNRARVTQA